MKKIINAKVFNGEEFLTDSVVVIDGDKIKYVGSDCGEYDCATVDAKGKYLVPGFVDLQVNGGGGVLFNDDTSIEGLTVMAKAHESLGTLYILPTLISTDHQRILKAITAVKEAMKCNPAILGMHLEGPFLFPKKGGVHEGKYIRDCSFDELREIVEMGKDVIKIITVAPEACTEEQIAYLKENGINVFIGHSNSTCAQSLQYLKAGAIGVTHLYNAMSQLNSREPGIVGASFLTDSWAGIVVDGFHVDFNSVKIACAVKRGKIFLVTDAMPPVGKGDMDFKIGDVEIHCVNHKCLSNDGVIAGSALYMNKGLQNLVHNCNLSLEEGLKMTSAYQAQALNLCGIGAIKEGCFARLLLLNDDLAVDKIICGE